MGEECGQAQCSPHGLQLRGGGGWPPRGGYATGERSGLASDVSITSCEGHPGGVHFTAAFRNSSSRPPFHRGDPSSCVNWTLRDHVAGLGRNRLGCGTVPGRTQGVLEGPRPSQALVIPQVEGDDWRLQAGEEVDLGDEGPPVACGSSIPSDQEAS